MSYKRITKTKIDKLKGQAHIFIIILKIKYKVAFNASLIDSAIWTSRPAPYMDILNKDGSRCNSYYLPTLIFSV